MIARTAGAVVLGAALSSCMSTTDSGDCVSRYEPVARGSTWSDLKDAMLQYDGRRPVTSVRVQERGVDVGAGDQEAVRVVDLLDRKGRRVVQADVWRTDDGGWRAGVWSQCID